MGIRISLAILLIVSILTACAAPAPTPTPTALPSFTAVPTQTVFAQEPEATPTPPPATKTPEPTRTPTPPPTPAEIRWSDGTVLSAPLNKETVKTNSPSLVEVTRMQDEAFARGEIKIPLAQEVLDVGGDFRYLYNNDYSLLEVVIPEGKTVVSPNLLAGRVSLADNVNKVMFAVGVERGDFEIIYYFPFNGSFLVKPGPNTTGLGEPLFSITSDQKDPHQLAFQNAFIHRPPEGFVIHIALREKTGELQPLSLGNLLTAPGSSEVVSVSTASVLK